MITDELAAVMARFFEAGRGPSHDELSRHFRRAGLEGADPQPRLPGETIGKMKRVREVLSYAVDHNPEAGDNLVRSLLGTIKAAGGFRPGSPEYAGDGVVQAARAAFHAEGYDLDFDGNLRQIGLDNLDAPEANEVLRVYIHRAQAGASDAALVVGTGKDLLEATARHVLVQATGTYPSNSNFPATLYQAFERLGLAASPKMLDLLDSDPHRALAQSLYVLANAVNRLRNAEGTGHGRPFLPQVTDEQARTAIRAMGLTSEFLLNASPSTHKKYPR